MAAALLISGLANARAGTEVSTNDLALIPDTPSLWKESLLWDYSATLRAGLGYKDNVPLSATAPQGSPFFTSGLDLVILRLPLDSLGFEFSVTGDDKRYWRDIQGIQGEDFFQARAQLEKYFGGHWRAGLEIRDVYADQVQPELLDSTGGVQVIQAKGDALTARPFIRCDLGTNWWVQLEAPISRDWWLTPLDDYWQYGAQVILGRNFGRQSEISLTGGAFYLPHDDWHALDSTGTNNLGRTLAIWRQLAELKWTWHWDAARHWFSTTKLGFQHDQDNGGGYFDYNRYSVSHALRFQTENWLIEGTAMASYYDFLVQPAVTAPGPTLSLGLLTLSARVERRVFKSLRLFAAYEHEQGFSNDPTSEYKSNIASGGLSWEF
jgi:hypothetical protein